MSDPQRHELYSFIAPESMAGPPSGGSEHLRACIQPSLSVRGRPTEAGSPALRGYVALEDAFVVEALRGRGIQLPASVHMSELGFGLAGDTTGRAVQEEFPAGLVTDAFGESRVIAAGHRLVGFKPSQGIVSRRGLIGLIPSMETLAVVARDIPALHFLLQAMVTPDTRDFSMMHHGLPCFSPSCPPRRVLRSVGVIAEALDSLSDAGKVKFREHLERLVQKGFTVEDLSWPAFPLARKVHQAIGSVEASSSAGKFDSVRYGQRVQGAANWNEMYLRSRAEYFGTLLKSFLFQGAHFQFNDYEAYRAACRLRRRLLNEVEDAFSRVDLLAMPVRQRDGDPGTAETVEDVYDLFHLTLLANLAGVPAVTFPGPESRDGDDPGLQLFAPGLHDRELMEAAAAILE